MTTPVSAPGKAFLIGEYAVLEGAPALVAALNVHAVAHPARPELGEKADESSPFVLTALVHAKEALHVHGLTPSIAAPIVSTLGFTLGDRKLGLGSSAAVSVAVVGYAFASAGLNPEDARIRREIATVAKNAHAQAQGGIGSGGDIYASTFGGFVRVQNGEVAHGSVPNDLAIGFFDAGAPARTEHLVRQVLAARSQAEESYGEAMRILAQAGETFLAALARPSATNFSALASAVELHNRGLALLHEISRASILTPNLLRIIEEARSLRLAAKPSGAGGGDLAVVFAENEAQLDHLANRLFAKHRIARISGLRVDSKGVCIAERAPVNSRLAGFFKLPVEKRREALGKLVGLTPQEFTASDADGLGQHAAAHMIENVIGTLELPLAVATNFRINGRDVVIPMCIEEASVVAAASNAAKMIRAGGGFIAHCDPPWMIAQIQLVGLGDVHQAAQAVLTARDEILKIADSAQPRLVARGGGARDLEVRILVPYHLVVHLLVDCRDAMGANLLNEVAEKVAAPLERITGRSARLRILSNLADRRMTHVHAKIPVHALASNGWDGAEVAKAIVEASQFAELDPYRATTHNKGIMNGVDAVILATGNDWRAMEASAHAYAAQSGRYRPLATWKIGNDGALEGEMTLPTAVGVVGGATRSHPTARMALKIMGEPSSLELGQMLASAGLASNLAALRALATEGISRGHMGLHARSVALSAGARGEEIEIIAARLVEIGEIKAERAQALLRETRSQG
jgi:degradative hydroxymethylglutaryl-CoA reductase